MRCMYLTCVYLQPGTYKQQAKWESEVARGQKTLTDPPAFFILIYKLPPACVA